MKNIVSHNVQVKGKRKISSHISPFSPLEQFPRSIWFCEKTFSIKIISMKYKIVMKKAT